MKEDLQEMLAGRMPLPGMVAWGFRLADRTVTAQSYKDSFKPKQIEQVLLRLTVAAESLSYHRIDPVRQCWTFEHLRIHLGLRRDGASLALFVENRPEAGGQEIDAILQEFATFTL